MKKLILIITCLLMVSGGLVYASSLIQPKGEVIDAVTIDNRPSIIDDYFEARNMPLKGYGKKMVEVADSNGLDWRLLPALSVRESSGGKQMCENNPFGWGSCKITFKSIDEAIETVGYKLANLSVYKGKTTEIKLYYYNGTVIKTYPQEVIAIMDKIAIVKPPNE